MSLKTFFEKLKNFAVNLFAKAGEWGPKAVSIGRALKTAVADPRCDVVVNLTETKIDDNGLRILRNVLDFLFPGTATGTDTDVIKAKVAEIRKLSPAMQNAAIAKVSSLMLKEYSAAAGKPISSNEADLVAQMSYSYEKAHA